MSGRENDYSKIVTRYSDEELMQLLTDHEKYVEGLLEAALWEAQKRNLHHPFAEEIEKSITHEEIPLIVTEEPPVIHEAETKTVILPPLYSQGAIMGFTLFLSPLFGGIMLAMNVWKVYKKGVVPIILFSVVYTIVIEYTALKIQQQNVLNILLPVIGALILSNVLWNKYIGRKVQYEKRSIRIPFIIALLILIPVAYIIYTHPELLPLPEKI